MAIKLDDLDPLTYRAGTYKYKAVVSTGPILIQSKMPGESVFSTVTDGSIAASEDKLIDIAEDELIQVSLEAGDEFYLTRVDRGRV
jgi:hypothetical protein